MFTNKFDIKALIECAVEVDITNDVCVKMIKYYTGDNFKTELKIAIADFYCVDKNAEYLNKAVEILSEDDPRVVSVADVE